jgi:hypothetical protein
VTTGFTDTTAGLPPRHQLAEELRAEQDHNLLLTEQLADLEMALDDKGWRTLAGDVRDEFSPQGRRALTSICRMMAVSNPLLKRGLILRIAYIWGRGVELQARGKAEGDDGGQDVNAVVQAFWDDNTKSLTGSQAQEELERALGTDGGVYLAAFTMPLNGRVQIRSTPSDEITDIITNPEDRDEPWYYVREYTERVFEPGYGFGNTRLRAQTTKVAHPALGYRPSTRPRQLNNMEVRWDAPILHIPVNRLDGWSFGIPDVYASVAWTRMYRDFLVDWAGLTHSLAKFAWKLTGDTKGKAGRAASAVRGSERGHLASQGLPGPSTSGAGQAAAMGPGSNLEAIPKSGAHIDAESGKPLAAMVAAGIGLPVTLLLADPGVTGARATAETLDKPTILEMGMRRLLWQAKLTELLDYVIDQAVLAPQGMLKGTLARDEWGRSSSARR